MQLCIVIHLRRNLKIPSHSDYLIGQSSLENYSSQWSEPINAYGILTYLNFLPRQISTHFQNKLLLSSLCPFAVLFIDLFKQAMKLIEGNGIKTVVIM